MELEIVRMYRTITEELQTIFSELNETQKPTL
jgi:hypothetical protein